MKTKRRWLVVISGGPGAGKTTLAYALEKALGGFVFEIGALRQIHLNRQWTNISPQEERMTFLNYVSILKGYRRLGLGPVIGADFGDERIRDLCRIFKPSERLLISLVMHDSAEHRRRILDPKADRGFRRYDAAWAWNESVKMRKPMRGELRIATDSISIRREASLAARAFRSKGILPGKIPSQGGFFDMEDFFRRHPVAPWNRRPGKHVNEGWEKASRNEYRSRKARRLAA